MKTRELIEALQKLDPEKEVMIQQGGEHDFMTVHTVKEVSVWDEDAEEGEDEQDIIGIYFV